MPIDVGYGIPENYEYINLYNAQRSPSTVHVKNAGLTRFFSRYLFQKAISVFQWRLPETWNRDYFLYVLYAWGFIAVVETDKFGVICQAAAPYGYDIFYQPTHMIISNPLIKNTLQPRIGMDCSVFKLQPDWGGISDLVDYYADMMALCAEAAGVNLLNSHLSYVFPAKDKNAAESYKKMFDRVAGGEPAVVVDKSLFQDSLDGTWHPFAQNLKQTYLVTDILSDMRKIEAMFDTDIGIPNANTDKRERLITDEVNANNYETASKCALWLEELQKAAAVTNRMFGTNIAVNWRYPEIEEGGAENAERDDNLRAGTV